MVGVTLLDEGVPLIMVHRRVLVEEAQNHSIISELYNIIIGVFPAVISVQSKEYR